MITRIDDYIWLRYNKQEYRQHVFPRKKEYYRCLDMFLACSGILHTSLEYLHPKTIKFREVYKKEILDNIGALPGPRAKYGCLLPMQQIKDNPEFQKKFQEHTEFLASIIKTCDKSWHPAESELCEPEIRFVLYTHPELADRIRNQSRSVGQILLRKGKTNLLDYPPAWFVDSMTARQTQSVPFDKRDIDFEVSAVVCDKLPIQSMHYELLPGFIESRMTDVLSNDEMKKLVCEIEKLGAPVFGDALLEKMRLAFIDKYKWQYNPREDGFVLLKPLVSYMRNPSKKVKEASIKKNPYTICGIKYQYDAIQELALRTMFAKRTEYFKQSENARKNLWENPWNMQMLRLMLARPSVRIEKLYMDLVRKR